MKRNETRILVIVLVISCMLLCSFSTSEAAPSPTGELRLAIDRMGSSAMDPVLQTTSSKPLFTPFFDYLFGVDTAGNVSAKTGIATDWKLAPDAKKLTVNLRSGVRFHNGDELTSADVKFSLEQFTSKRAIASNSDFLRAVIKNVEAPDAKTVIINYKEPCAVLPHYLSRLMNQEGVILPKKYMEQKGIEYFNEHPVGSGPYKFV
jgi:peptide/nickel transport system substrate-binding protein